MPSSIQFPCYFDIGFCAASAIGKRGSGGPPFRHHKDLCKSRAAIGLGFKKMQPCGETAFSLPAGRAMPSAACVWPDWDAPPWPLVCASDRSEKRLPSHRRRDMRFGLMPWLDNGQKWRKCRYAEISGERKECE
jgi:hypothetical protein